MKLNLIPNESLEDWKPITGYENYLISNKGNVFRKKTEFFQKGKYSYFKKETVISLQKLNGYNRVSLYKNGVRKRVLVHVLVAKEFLVNTDNKTEVNHKNGVKHDNRVDNLEWCTPSENRYHSYNVLKQKKPNSKFTEDDVLKIRNLNSSGVKIIDIAKEYNVVHSTISEIVKFKRYK